MINLCSVVFILFLLDFQAFSLGLSSFFSYGYRLVTSFGKRLLVLCLTKIWRHLQENGAISQDDAAILQGNGAILQGIYPDFLK